MNINDRMIMTDFILGWGEDIQIIITMEECAELTKILSKYLRAPFSHTSRADYIENIIEEIVDVSLMLEQMKIVVGLSSKRFNTLFREKLDRTYEVFTEYMKKKKLEEGKQ